jgi:hypothetical protein
MPLNTNHPTPPKGASCSKVGIPEGVPRLTRGFEKPTRHTSVFHRSQSTMTYKRTQENSTQA